jgi:Carboxypeptidase regulatory-like domain/TonB-dependent Receptor Plug Domain/TonB dependent receptor
MSFLRSLFVIVLFAAIFSASSFAQSSRGTVSGLVTDPSGAAVAAATVQIVSVETSVARDTTTNGNGLYRFDAVDPGNYTVSVKVPGFRSAQISAFSVAAAQVVAVDVKLEIGETTSTVEVTSAAAALQTESAVRGGSIETKDITELPFSNRNPVTLVLNLPGVTTNRQSNGVATFSVNGTRSRSNNFQIDGTENNDISVAGQAFQIKNPEAVQEVSAQTSNFDSEYGRAGGAVVNVITKSGTNQFHGSAGYLLDVTNDDAITNTQGLSTAVQQRGKPLPGTDQWFFGSLGGAIIKNRTFFFGSELEERQNSAGSVTRTTPSAAGLATLNSLFPTGTNKNVDLYRSIIGNTIATSQFTNQVLGNGRPDIQFGTASFSYPNKYIEHSPTIRIDHRISDKDLLSGRFLYDDQTFTTASITFPGFGTSQHNRYQNALISETHIFSPSFTNELRLPYNRITLDFPVDTSNPLGSTLPAYSIAGISGFGVATNLPQGRIANNYGLQDTVTWVRGTHSIRAGIDLLDQRSRQFAPIVQRGALSYAASTGYSSFANFVDDFGGSGGLTQRDFGNPAYYPTLFRQAYFAQDRWRFNSNLTISYGIRYEYFGLPVNSIATPAFTGLFNINPNTFTGPYNQPNSVAADKNNFSPSIGLAYSPENGGWLLGNKKSVIRAGYNIGYDSFFNNISSNAATSAPNVVSTLFNSAVTTTNTRGAAGLSGLLPLVPRALTPGDTQALVDSHLVNPYYQHWSFTIQRELFSKVIVEVGYVGTKGTKLFAQEDLNPQVPAALRITPAGPVPTYGYTLRYDNLQGSRSIRTNDGSSTYHAAQVQVSRRFNSGVSFSGAYTWSKLLDYQSDVFTTNNTVAISQTPTIFGGMANERAVSLFDRPQRAVFTYIYALPFYKSQQGLVGRVLGGWELSGITTLESGVPYTIVNGLDSDGFSGSGPDRPDYNPLGQKGVRAQVSASSPTGYVNPENNNAPVDPKTAEYIGLPAFNGTTSRVGTLGRNTARQPGIANTDFNVVKRITIKERVGLEFRAEFFNVFNHPQLGYASISPFSPGGGTIASSVSGSTAGRFLDPQFLDGGGRVIRYQLKLTF